MDLTEKNETVYIKQANCTVIRRALIFLSDMPTNVKITFLAAMLRHVVCT